MFRDVPLIRDEGEFVHLGQRILQGDVPYLDLYNQKTPFAFYFMAAVQGVAGESLRALRVATTLWGLVAVVLTHVCVRRLFGRVAGGVGALAFALLSFHQNGSIHQASGEGLGSVWMIAALTLWYWPRATRPVLLVSLAGAAAGVAYQTKQSALVVLVFLLADTLWSQLRNGRGGDWREAARNAALLCAGFLAVLAAVAASFALQGAFAAYVECTWTNNFEYVGARPSGWLHHWAQLRWALRIHAGPDVWLWLLGAVGLLSLELRARPQRGHALWLLLLGTLAMALAGGKPFRQYYEPVVLPLAMGVGAAASLLWQTFANRDRAPWLRLGCFVLAVAIWVAPASRTVEILNERDRLGERLAFWSAAESMGRWIRKDSEPGDRLLVVGSEPEIYFHANRAPVTRMVITYPMLGPYSYSEALRSEFIAALRRDLPDYVVRVASAGSLSEGGADVPAFLASVSDALGPTYEQIGSTETDPPTGGGRGSRATLTLYRRSPRDTP